MLLDLYLPDEHGLKLVARLRDGHPPVDVIVITAAKDADSVRVAMQGGALHYLLKPFSFPVLRDKLLSYAQMRTRLSAVREADQRTVDRVFGALRAPDQLAGVKGRSVHTLEAVEQLLSDTRADLSAAEVAERHRHEPRHRPALSEPPARSRPGGHPAALRQRRTTRTWLPEHGHRQGRLAAGQDGAFRLLRPPAWACSHRTRCAPPAESGRRGADDGNEPAWPAWKAPDAESLSSVDAGQVMCLVVRE